MMNDYFYSCCVVGIGLVEISMSKHVLQQMAEGKVKTIVIDKANTNL